MSDTNVAITNFGFLSIEDKRKIYHLYKQSISNIKKEKDTIHFINPTGKVIGSITK